MTKISHKLSVPNTLESSAEIDSPGFQAPLDADRCPPPTTAFEVPHVDLSASLEVLGTAGTERTSVHPHGGRQQGQIFSYIEIQMALQLRSQGLTLEDIGRRIGRSAEGVRRVVNEWGSTTELAKAVYKRDAVKLAERAVQDADVNQALEISDRLDVLPKREKETVGNRVQVIVGVNLDDVRPAVVVQSESEDIV